MEKIDAIYTELVETLIKSRTSITCMESMTGGFIASCITDIPGASTVFRGSYVCYSNEEKIRLGVAADTITEYTVYSAETALSMATAARNDFKSDIAIGITGNAGNVDPANLSGRPGRVFIAIVTEDVEKSFGLSLDALLSRREMKEIVAVRTAEEVLRLLNQKEIS